MRKAEVNEQRQALMDALRQAHDEGDDARVRQIQVQLEQLRRKANGEGGKGKGDRKSSASLADAVHILQSPSWDCLAYNERTTELMWLRKPPCQTAHRAFPAALIDADFTSIVTAFDANDLKLSYENAFKSAVRAALFRSFDPVRDYLDRLTWDGEERLPSWLETYFGAGVDHDDDDEAQAAQRTFVEEIGKRWMISAVARVYEPGCQVDSILIAEGPQGIGKSSAFRALAVEDAWFATDLPDIRHKDAVHHLLGPWLLELDELDALTRREATSVKSFVSRRADRARLSYGKVSTNHPRRVVFCGTTNEDTYNQDATGGRRYWPFIVRHPIDVPGIVADRDQLWAEAVHRYRAGEAWHLEDEALQDIARAEQGKRFKASVWLADIEDHLIGKTEVTVADILTDCLDKPKAQQTQRDMNEVVRCLQHLGWRIRQVRRPGGKKVRVYEKP